MGRPDRTPDLPQRTKGLSGPSPEPSPILRARPDRSKLARKRAGQDLIRHESDTPPELGRLSPIARGVATRLCRESLRFLGGVIHFCIYRVKMDDPAATT